MSDIAIRVAGLGKRYRIGARKLRHDTLRDSLAHSFDTLFRRRRAADASAQVFWALKDVSFEVNRGDVLGLIGRNGAGKSTLLKVLSRITVPTEGHAEMYGRLGSLLEVGTGFNTELTGRENIYLSGAIMGMRKAEIDRKFDEIVEFAEVAAFIDTPVKRYSSGMYVRLAFAVAAHLETEILIVDEVLAVGDAAFQKKCLGKMGNVAKQGRTVLFVSHNMSTVQNLCNTGLVLDKGGVTFWGTAGEAVNKYLMTTTPCDFGCADLQDHPGRAPDMPAIVQSIALRGTTHDVFYRDTVTTGDEVVFEIRYDTGGRNLDYAVLAINSQLGDRVCTVGTHLCPEFDARFVGKGMLECRLPRLALTHGEYSVMVAMGTNLPRRNTDMVEDALRFRVESGDYFGTGASTLMGQGYMAQRSEWRLVSDSPRVLA
jgi:lipopolysaccharide transport system ATP-binding protein